MALFGGEKMKVNSMCYLDLTDKMKFVGLEEFKSKTGRGYILPEKAADELYKKTHLGDRFSIVFLMKKHLCKHDLEIIYSSEGINSARGKHFNFYYCHKCSFYQCNLEE